MKKISCLIFLAALFSVPVFANTTSALDPDYSPFVGTWKNCPTYAGHQITFTTTAQTVTTGRDPVTSMTFTTSRDIDGKIYSESTSYNFDGKLQPEPKGGFTGATQYLALNLAPLNQLQITHFTAQQQIVLVEVYQGSSDTTLSYQEMLKPNNNGTLTLFGAATCDKRQ
jgi:hypothetical protein